MTDDTIHRRKRKNFYFYRLIYLLYPRPILCPIFAFYVIDCICGSALEISDAGSDAPAELSFQLT